LSLLPALALAGAKAEFPPDHLPRAPLPAFERALAAQPSATRALAEWCGARFINWPDPPEITASMVPGPAMPPPRGARRLLAIGNEEPLGFRHVRLACGETVLSEAYNWYVPGRLTADMNRLLESTRTPFGKVAAPLGFSRTALASRRGAAPGCPSDTILTNRGLLRLPDGRGLALVLECYTRANVEPLYFMPPPRAF
jgi:hypothetical protein